MDELDIEMYLKAKKQYLYELRITFIALVAGAIYVLLAVFDIQLAYFDIITGAVVFAALTIRSRLFGSRVSTSDLLNLIENQISRDPNATKFVAFKRT